MAGSWPRLIAYGGRLMAPLFPAQRMRAPCVSKEPMESAAGRVERGLLLRAVMNQGAAISIDRIMQKPVHRQLSQRRIKEAFQQLWDYNSPAWAAKFLDEWCRQTMRSRIEPMKKIARSLRQHRELILNYFRAQKLISSGVVEGLNNKAKVTMRKSYGFRTFRVLELALYHSLGKLPEPESKSWRSVPPLLLIFS